MQILHIPTPIHAHLLIELETYHGLSLRLNLTLADDLAQNACHQLCSGYQKQKAQKYCQSLNLILSHHCEQDNIHPSDDANRQCVEEKGCWMSRHTSFFDVRQNSSYTGSTI